MQIVFQDPFASMNPRMMVGDIIEEGMLSQRVGGTAAERRARVDELLQQVGLGTAMRVTAIRTSFQAAKGSASASLGALAVEPQADHLRRAHQRPRRVGTGADPQPVAGPAEPSGLAYLFITHNISVVAYLAHEVAVMYLGRIVEHGPVQAVLQSPQHPYTRSLLSAVPVVDPTTTPRGDQAGRRNPLTIQSAGGLSFPSALPRSHATLSRQLSARDRPPNGHCVRCFLYDDKRR